MVTDAEKLLHLFANAYPRLPKPAVWCAATVVVQRAMTGKPDITPERYAELMKDAGI